MIQLSTDEQPFELCSVVATRREWENALWQFNIIFAALFLAMGIISRCVSWL